MYVYYNLQVTDKNLMPIARLHMYFMKKFKTEKLKIVNDILNLLDEYANNDTVRFVAKLICIAHMH